MNGLQPSLSNVVFSLGSANLSAAIIFTEEALTEKRYLAYRHSDNYQRFNRYQEPNNKCNRSHNADQTRDYNNPLESIDMDNGVAKFKQKTNYNNPLRNNKPNCGNWQNDKQSRVNNLHEIKNCMEQHQFYPTE